MSATIAPPGWPANQSPEMTVEERREYINRQITLWVGNQRLDQSLAAEELGQYSGMQKALLLRNGLLVGAIRHCRLNPRADTRMSVLVMITFLADNNDGICRLSVTRMCEIFARSRESIVTSIASLEKDGQIGVDRKDGMPSSYWPLIPAALAELSANPVWFVEALSTKPKFRVFGSPEEAIAVATQDRSTRPDQSGTPDQYQSGRPDHHRSTLVDEPVNSSRRTGQEQSCSISLSNSPSSQGKKEGAPKTGANAARGSRLSADWILPDDWRAWTHSAFRVSPHKVQLEADKFRDYWHAKAGSGATKLDWAATWRTWCRKGFEKFAIPAASQQTTAAPDREREAYNAQLLAAGSIDP